jgi:uncharacterized membrane protein YgaE (UPF0421/DUF939 family)
MAFKRGVWGAVPSLVSSLVVLFVLFVSLKRKDMYSQQQQTNENTEEEVLKTKRTTRSETTTERRKQPTIIKKNKKQQKHVTGEPNKRKTNCGRERRRMCKRAKANTCFTGLRSAERERVRGKEEKKKRGSDDNNNKTKAMKKPACSER